MSQTLLKTSAEMESYREEDEVINSKVDVYRGLPVFNHVSAVCVMRNISKGGFVVIVVSSNELACEGRSQRTLRLPWYSKGSISRLYAQS